MYLPSSAIRNCLSIPLRVCGAKRSANIGKRGSAVYRKLGVRDLSSRRLPYVEVYKRVDGDIEAMELESMDGRSNRFADMLEYGTGRIAFGGHRGFGANSWNPDGGVASAEFRENTVLSFTAAAKAGCTFIEFDIQVTSDGHAVIFHDNYLVFGSEASPTSSLVKNLSLADFKGLAPINSSSESMSLMGGSDDDSISTAWMPLSGSSPMGGSPAGGSPLRTGTAAAAGRLMRQHENGVPAKPFEPSLRPWEVANEDDFPTLAEVFDEVPSSVAFDIEIKMTTPDDIEISPPEEVDRIVNTTLAAVDAAERALVTQGRPQRTVMYSSFDPEVCMKVKELRPGSVVMFLSGGGAYAHVDRRRTSVQGAIDFASSAGLDGVILESFVLKQQQGMIEVALKKGLHMMTYGVHNNEPEWVKEQEQLGIHAVIVDDVSRVATALW